MNKINPNKFCTIYINATQNNTIITARTLENLTLNLKSKLLGTQSVGLSLKVKRGKKSVSQGSLIAGENLGVHLYNSGYTHTQVFMKGFGPGRENAIQGLNVSGLKIIEIFDRTRTPHNGCRSRKLRRV